MALEPDKSRSLCRTLETFGGTDWLLYGSWYNFAGEIFERRRILF